MPEEPNERGYSYLSFARREALQGSRSREAESTELCGNLIPNLIEDADIDLPLR